MNKFSLVEIVTSDKLIHQGIFFKPSKPRELALLSVHGLSSNFYGNISFLEVLAEFCEKNGVAFASFNNRGHDMIAGLRKMDQRKPKGYAHKIGGAGYEKFNECIYDIEAGVDFLKIQGFKKVIVIGHSTGANKVCYYGAKSKNNNVSGFVLVSPVSDRLDPSLNSLKRQQDLSKMQEMVNLGKGDELLTNYHYFPLTPQRYLSLFSENSQEDVFDYGDPRPRMSCFSKIKKPLLVILAGSDELIDRPIKQIKQVFDYLQKSSNYKSVIIPHALHSFNNQESELAKQIIGWSKSL